MSETIARTYDDEGQLVSIDVICHVGRVLDAGSAGFPHDVRVRARGNGRKSMESAYNGNCVVLMHDPTDPSRVLMYDSKAIKQRIHRDPVVMQTEDVGELFAGMRPEMIGAEQSSAGIFTLEGLLKAADEDGNPEVYHAFAHELTITLDTVAQSVSVGNTVWDASSDTERTGAYNTYTYAEWQDFASGVIGGEFDEFRSQPAASVS